MTVSPLTAVWLPEKQLPGIDIYANYVSFKAKENGAIISEGTVTFVPAKYFVLEDPQLKVTAVSEKELKVEAGSFAKNIEIRNADDDLLLSDNFFDMNPGERTIGVIRGSLEGLTVRSVYDIR